MPRLVEIGPVILEKNQWKVYDIKATQRTNELSSDKSRNHQTFYDTFRNEAQLGDNIVHSYFRGFKEIALDNWNQYF